MQCPYCKSPLPANAIECPACRLSYPRTSTLLGAVPRLTPMVADTTRILRSTDHVHLKRRITAIQSRFPQLTLQVVIHQFPADYPFSLHVFWLFNAAVFASVTNRGRNNHTLLIVLDPTRSEAAMMPGYGLEPYLSGDALSHLLERGGPFWEKHQWSQGIMQILHDLDQLLETIAVPDELALCAEGEY